MSTIIVDPLPYSSRDLFLMNALLRHLYAGCQEDGTEMFVALKKRHAYWVRSLFGGMRELRFVFVDDDTLALTDDDKDPRRIVRVDCSSLPKSYSMHGLRKQDVRKGFVASRVSDLEEKMLKGIMDRYPTYIVVIPGGESGEGDESGEGGESGSLMYSRIPEGVPRVTLDDRANPFDSIMVLEKALQVHVSSSSHFVLLIDFLRLRAPTFVHYPMGASHIATHQNPHITSLHA